MRVRVEASAGVAVVEEPVNRPAGDPTLQEAGMVELLRRADVAMYQAKRGGPQIVRYDPSPRQGRRRPTDARR